MRAIFEKLKVNSEFLIVLAILTLAISIRIFLLLEIEWQSDEAMWGLMAKHILEGRTLPIFFYNANYMGALDGYLGALISSLFGLGMIQMRAGPLLVSTAFLIAFYLLARRLYNKSVALWSLTTAAFPSYSFAVWAIFSLGGYPWTQLFITCSTLLMFHILEKRLKVHPWKWILLGFLIGFSLYTHYIVAVFWLVAGVGLLYEERSKLFGYTGPVLLGFVLGFSPALIHYFVIGAREVGFPPGQTGAVPDDWGFIFRHTATFFADSLPKMLGIKMRNPILPLPWYASVLAALFYASALIYYAYFTLRPERDRERMVPDTVRSGEKDARGWGRRVLLGYAIVHSLVYIGSGFGAGFIMRYLTPLLIPFSLALGLALHRLSGIRQSIAVIVVILFIGFNCYGYYIATIVPQEFCDFVHIPLYTIEEIDSFCAAHNIKHLHAGFYTANKLTFLSREKRIAAGTIGPYVRTNYPDFHREAVCSDPRAAYLLYNFPNLGLTQTFEEEMARLGIAYQQETIGLFTLYYGFSRPFRFEDIRFPEF